MAQCMTNAMASAMAVVTVQNMAHSTPLHSTTRFGLVCGLSWSSFKSKERKQGAGLGVGAKP